MQIEWLGMMKVVVPRLMAGLVCIAGLLLVIQAAGADQGETDPLWRKAVDYMGRNVWVPGELESRERVYNLKGDLEEEERVVLNLSPAKNDKVWVRLVLAEENGKDVTSQFRSQLEGKSALREILEPSPFRPEKGQVVKAWRNGETRTIDGRTCIGFAFSFETGDAALEGGAWLDGEQGLPLEAHAEIVSVPFKGEGVRVTAYTEVQEFTITEQGDCLLVHTRTDMSIEVPGFEGQVRVFNLAKKHWRHTPEKE